jgi:hypothetical protein
MINNFLYLKICFIAFIFLSCRNSYFSKSQRSLKNIDSLGLGNKSKNELWALKFKSGSFSSIIDKVENNEDLNNYEYSVLFDSLFVNNDESLSEQNGYLMFNYLKENINRGKNVSTFLLSKSKCDRDLILSKRVRLMCIDILDENYNYNRFIKEFKLFNKIKKAEIAFKDCLKNK